MVLCHLCHEASVCCEGSVSLNSGLKMKETTRFRVKVASSLRAGEILLGVERLPESQGERFAAGSRNDCTSLNGKVIKGRSSMNERPNHLFCSFREVKKIQGNRWPGFSHENQGLTVHSWGICPDSRF